MNDTEHVLNHFFLGRKRLPVHDNDFCSVIFTENFESFKTESDKPVFVSHDHGRNLAGLDHSHNGKEVFPFIIQAASEYHTAIVRQRDLWQCGNLPKLFSAKAYPVSVRDSKHDGKQQPFCCGTPDMFKVLFMRIISSVRRCSFCDKNPVSVPALQSVY